MNIVLFSLDLKRIICLFPVAEQRVCDIFKRGYGQNWHTNGWRFRWLQYNATLLEFELDAQTCFQSILHIIPRKLLNVPQRWEHYRCFYRSVLKNMLLKYFYLLTFTLQYNDNNIFRILRDVILRCYDITRVHHFFVSNNTQYSSSNSTRHDVNRSSCRIRLSLHRRIFPTPVGVCSDIWLHWIFSS